jgi:hypothetical protein
MALLEAFRYFSDQELLAGNMYGEARFTEDSEMEEMREYLAIGCVVMSRVRSHRWPGTAKEVILQKSQFSWLNPGDPSGELVYQFLRHKQPEKLYKPMMGVALSILEGRTSDFSNGANHYIALWLWRQKLGTSHWCQRFKLTEALGGHLFFDDGLG